MNYSNKLIPGTQFPAITVKTIAGETVSLQASGKYKLVVIYRGAFCPFCQATMKDIQARIDDLKNAEIEEVIAISADKEDVAKKFAQDYGLTFPVGYDLTVPQIREMGLYVSAPTNYIEQEQSFSEPGYFFLNPDNSIRYIDVASAPFGGRVNIDYLINGFGWVKEQERTRPGFKTVMWGSK
jgi:peroxiredoxin